MLNYAKVLFAWCLAHLYLFKQAEILLCISNFLYIKNLYHTLRYIQIKYETLFFESKKTDCQLGYNTYLKRGTLTFIFRLILNRHIIIAFSQRYFRTFKKPLSWFNKGLLKELFSSFLFEANAENIIDFVKIILLKTDNCALTLRKRLFCDAKPTLLPCKTAAFGMQNNRFYNALIMKALHDRDACEKYLQTYDLFPVYKNGLKNNGEQNLLHSVRHLLPIRVVSYLFFRPNIEK